MKKNRPSSKNLSMSARAEITTTDEVSPSEIAAVEAALRHLETQRKSRQVLGHIAQWFLVLKMYKDLELHFVKSKDRKQSEDKHRALLTGVMGIGEILVNESKEISEQEFGLINSSRTSLISNVRYLRDKYEQWFLQVDPEEIARVWPQLIAT